MIIGTPKGFCFLFFFHIVVGCVKMKIDLMTNGFIFKSAYGNMIVQNLNHFQLSQITSPHRIIIPELFYPWIKGWLFMGYYKTK